MTRKRKVLLLLLLPVMVIASSGLYKAATGFYSYKAFMCAHVVPRLYECKPIQPLTLHDVPHNLTVIQGLPIPSQWNPKAFTNKLGATGVRLTLRDNTNAEVYHHLRNLNDLRDWFIAADEGASTQVLTRYYGSWQNVRKKYPSDQLLLNSIFGTPLPSFLHQDSIAMKYPLGYYIFPLFPLPQSFKSTAPLNTVKSLHFSPSRSWYKAVGSNLYFYILQSDSATEIVYGATNGNVRGAFLLKDTKGPVDPDLMSTLCSCLDARGIDRSTEENGEQQFQHVP